MSSIFRKLVKKSHQLSIASSIHWPFFVFILIAALQCGYAFLFPFSFNLRFSTPAFPPLSMNQLHISFHSSTSWNNIVTFQCSLIHTTQHKTNSVVSATNQMVWIITKLIIRCDDWIVVDFNYELQSEDTSEHFDAWFGGIFNACHFELRSSRAKQTLS